MLLSEQGEGLVCLLVEREAIVNRQLEKVVA